MATAPLSKAIIASKYRGCMIGGLMGDCLGYPYEFHVNIPQTDLNAYMYNLIDNKTTRIFDYSDDSSMTLSIAKSLVEKGELNSKDMAEKFVAEFFNDPTERSYGSHVGNVFHGLKENNFEDIFLPAKKQFNGKGSFGNGAAMRIAPIVLFGNSKGEDYIMKAAEECSRITHTHPNGYNGAKLQCLAVNAALESDYTLDFDPVKFTNNLLEKMKKVESEGSGLFCSKQPYCDALKKMRDCLPKLQDRTGEEIAKCLGNDEIALKSVPTAIYSFLRGMRPIEDFEEPNPFVRTLYFAISVGGDTDTIASMAGSIAGAYYGADTIPKNIMKNCEKIDEFINLADKLFDMYQKK